MPSHLPKIKAVKHPETPVHLKGIRAIIPSTTALAGPEVVAIPVEGHEEDVLSASIRVPIEGAPRVAGHPGLASRVHLRRRCQLAFTAGKKT